MHKLGGGQTHKSIFRESPHASSGARAAKIFKECHLEMREMDEECIFKMWKKAARAEVHFLSLSLSFLGITLAFH